MNVRNNLPWIYKKYMEWGMSNNCVKAVEFWFNVIDNEVMPPLLNWHNAELAKKNEENKILMERVQTLQNFNVRLDRSLNQMHKTFEEKLATFPSINEERIRTQLNEIKNIVIRDMRNSLKELEDSQKTTAKQLEKAIYGIEEDHKSSEEATTKELRSAIHKIEEKIPDLVDLKSTIRSLKYQNTKLTNKVEFLESQLKTFEERRYEAPEILNPEAARDIAEQIQDYEGHCKEPAETEAEIQPETEETTVMEKHEAVSGEITEKTEDHTEQVSEGSWFSPEDLEKKFTKLGTSEQFSFKEIALEALQNKRLILNDSRSRHFVTVNLKKKYEGWGKEEWTRLKEYLAFKASQLRGNGE